MYVFVPRPTLFNCSVDSVELSGQSHSVCCLSCRPDTAAAFLASAVFRAYLLTVIPSYVIGDLYFIVV